MNIVKLSNLLNVLVYLHPSIKSYHLGWLTDTALNQDSNFDTDLEEGKTFPHLILLPPEGRLDLKNMKDNVEVEMRLYDLKGYDNTGELKTNSLIEHWVELQGWMVQIFRELMKGKNGGVREFGVVDGMVEWWFDEDNFVDNAVVVGMKFSMRTDVECVDWTPAYGTLPAELPHPVEGDDYELKRVT